MTVWGWIILLLVIVAALIALAAWFYERATNEVSLVKTGVGGRKVIIDGGTLAIPYFHEIAVNDELFLQVRRWQNPLYSCHFWPSTLKLPEKNGSEFK